MIWHERDNERSLMIFVFALYLSPPQQRHQFKLMQLARPSRLTKARVKQLDSIGFVWEASRRRLDGADSSESESETDDSITRAVRKKKKVKLNQLLEAGKPAAKSSYGLPVFAEPRRGRMGMDPPAALGTAMAPPGVPAQDPFAAAQAMMAAGQANMGIWAAAAAGRGPFMPPGMNPAAATAAAQQGINPAMFYQMPPWGVMMPGGLDLAQMQKMQASMMQASMAAENQQVPAASTGDPPTDSDTVGDKQGEENTPVVEQEASLKTQEEEEEYL